MSAADEPTNFLYPFIDAEEDDPSALLADLAESAQAKASESLALRRSTLEANADPATTPAACRNDRRSTFFSSEFCMVVVLLLLPSSSIRADHTPRSLQQSWDNGRARLVCWSQNP